MQILLVDDNPLVRLGVRQVVETQHDLAICCDTESIEKALSVTRTSRVDLAVVDMSVGTVDGLELIRWLREIKPVLPVMVYSLHDESLFAELAFRAGADGYVTKREAPTRLLHAMREVLAGRKYSSPRLPPNSVV